MTINNDFDDQDSPDLFDFVKTNTHSGGLETEIPSEETEAVTKKQKAMILSLLEEAGEDGMTPYALSIAVGCDNSQESGSPIRRRLYDLRNEGKVRHHPEKRKEPNDRGNPCYCWVLGEDPNRGKPVVSKEVARLRKRIAELEAEEVPRWVDWPDAPGKWLFYGIIQGTDHDDHTLLQVSKNDALGLVVKGSREYWHREDGHKGLFALCDSLPKP